MYPSAGDAAKIYELEFPLVLTLLRSGAITETRGVFSSGATIIQNLAQRSWVLEGFESPGFKIQTSQNILKLNELTFGNLAAQVCEKVLRSRDLEVAAAVKSVSSNTNIDSVNFIIRWTFALFCAHEFFHTEQRLDSDTYADSDRFVNVVTAADYQADIVAIDYLFTCIVCTHSIRTHRSVLLLLMLIHISVMQVFSPSAATQVLERAAFDRLLVWHFQAARIAASATCPDTSHPSLSTMPVIAFPHLEPKLGVKITWSKINGLLRTKSQGYPLVIGIGGSDGIVRILRLNATLHNRIPALIRTVLAEDFAAFRDEAEEFFKTHESLRRFDPLTPRYSRPSLERCLFLVEQILGTPAGADALSVGESLTAQLFETLLLHIDHNELTGPTWSGIREAVDKLRSQSRVARGQAARKRLSALVKQEVQRIEVRLNWTLDKLA